MDAEALLAVIRSAIVAGQMLALAEAGIARPESSAAPLPGCAGTGVDNIGREERGDAATRHAGVLIGRWSSPGGVLVLQVSQQLEGDVVFDDVAAVWEQAAGVRTSLGVAYATETRTVVLTPSGDGPPPAFTRLVLEPDGSALVAVPDAGGPRIRLARDSTLKPVPLRDLTQLRAGLSMRAEGAAVRVTAPSGRRASGRLTGPWPMTPAFEIELTVLPGQGGFHPGTFVCVGVVSEDPQSWDPFRYVMGGRIQRADGGAFSMQAFAGGDIRRFVRVPSDARGGRVRLIAQDGRVFTLYDDGRGWMPIATRRAELFEGLRLVILAGNDAPGGAYPALDFSIADLKVTGR